MRKYTAELTNERLEEFTRRLSGISIGRMVDTDARPVEGTDMLSVTVKARGSCSDVFVGNTLEDGIFKHWGFDEFNRIDCAQN